MRTHRTLALFGTAAALLFFVTGPAMAQKANLPEAVKKLIPAAQKEGTATIFGTTLNPRKVATINKSFNAFYGTDIKLIQTGGRHTRKRVEVARALKNNVPTGLDLFWTSSPRALVDSGSVTKFDWTKEFGLPASLKSGEYGIKTHDSYLTMVTINTNLVKPGDEPKTYDDLLDPKWKGKIAAPRSPSPWVNFSYAVGEKKAVSFLQHLIKKQELKLLPRYPDVRSRVIGGEFAIGIGTDAWAEIRKGAPVKHPNLDIVILSARAAYIVRDAKHPNVAKLWGYWVVSKEGQKTIHDVRGYSLISTKGTDMHNYVKGKKIHELSYDWSLKNTGRLTKVFRQVLRGKKR
jgi:iron(III) transport system substrate-binding protein